MIFVIYNLLRLMVSYSTGGLEGWPKSKQQKFLNFLPKFSLGFEFMKLDVTVECHQYVVFLTQLSGKL